MGGLVLDIVLIYLFKKCRRIFDFFTTSRWHRISATSTHAKVWESDWGGPSVNVNYEFSMDGTRIKASDDVPFFTHWHAQSYAESLKRGLHPVIRVNPQTNHETRFFERDQERS